MANKCIIKENRIKHLEFIQNVIDRLSHKSFLVKSWSITTITALVAFGIEKGEFRIFVLGFPVSLLFWYLDSNYLWLEKCFRQLYEAVMKREVTPMSMNISNYKKKISFWKMALRPTVWPIYLTELGILFTCLAYLFYN